MSRFDQGFAMNNLLMQRAADVLLVVGNIDEQHRIRETLRQAKVRNRLHHVGDAAEAGAYLRQEGPYMRAPVPGLVLLDAGLPAEGVVNLISTLKEDAQFAGIPVVVLVGSESEHRLIDNCIYAVDGSIEKPFKLAELMQILISFDTLSLLLVQSPPAA